MAASQSSLFWHFTQSPRGIIRGGQLEEVIQANNKSDAGLILDWKVIQEIYLLSLEVLKVVVLIAYSAGNELNPPGAPGTNMVWL